VHAIVANATIHDFDRARKALVEQGVPGVSQAPGFVAGYWTRSEDNRGLSMVVFESEDAARAAAEQLQSQGPPDPEAVTIENVEVREVVAHA
jgi:heme-degrading monooxygenase HmoA